MVKQWNTMEYIITPKSEITREVTEEFFVKECRREFSKQNLTPNHLTKDALSLIFQYFSDEESVTGKEILFDPQTIPNDFKEHYFEVFFTYNAITGRPTGQDNQEKMKEVIKKLLERQNKLIGFTKGKNKKHERVVYKKLT
jgi:hypothetical protein